MIVEHAVRLEAPAGRVWAAIERGETLRRVSRGAVGFRVDGDLPERWRPGQRVQMRPMLFHLLPSLRVRLDVVRVDPEAMVLETRERVGPIRRWRHRLTVTPAGERSCVYTERAEVRPGPLGPVVWVMLHALFRFRGWRLRRLAASL